MENLKAIRQHKGGSVTSLAQEFLEATKDVKPENFYIAIAAMQKAGKGG